MADDRRLDTLQDEIKLLKGELKNSLASVRDYLLNMELPSSEFSTILAALNADGGSQKITLDGNLANTMTTKPEEPGTEETEEEKQDEGDEENTDELEQPAEDEDLLNVEEPPADETEELSDENLVDEDENLVDEDESLNPEDALPPQDKAGENDEIDTSDEQDEAITPESELPIEEEQPMENEPTATDVSLLTPKVNMLANLINWVARAKKEIGYEQIPTFLEVYGISGHLSSELKEVIIHLAEISIEQPEVANNAEVWSQAMLALHGIITGGDAPLHPIMTSWTDNADEIQPVEEEIIEIDKTKEKPVKLKLVFPDVNGKSKEFCINLAPEEDRKNSSSSPDTE
jgi:hypothetical protein